MSLRDDIINDLSIVVGLSDRDAGDVADALLADQIRHLTIKGGEVQTTWVRLVFWDKLAAIVEQYCSKGSQIAIVGELQVREFMKDGNRQTSTEVRVHSLDLLGGKSERSEGSEPRYPANGDKRSSRREPSENDNREDFDDELPF